MKTGRRHFLRAAGLTGLGMAGGLSNLAKASGDHQNSDFLRLTYTAMHSDLNNLPDDEDISLIGKYGNWAASLHANRLPSLSFRRKEWSDIASWRNAARQRFTERLAMPDIGGMPAVKLVKQYAYDGLHIEELTWQLPYGNPTRALLLKPLNAAGPLPGIVAFHDHGGNKYFGTRKITRISDDQHPLIRAHQQEYYGGMAWANEIARRGYVVLVPDAFSFASRRVMVQDVPMHLRRGLTDQNPEESENIQAYNEWASEHEHIMAKSLFSAGTTWPGVFIAEDRNALDVLCSRNEVDASRVGCGGLSGGGLRTVYLGALDPRIKCAVSVGFMTTWKDFLVYKSFTHTWMIYVPLLSNELDFPEIMGIRAPLPTMILNNEQDQLFTLGEMKKAERILHEVFSKAKAEDHFQCSYYPGLHKFDAAMQQDAFAWFDRWLGGK